MEEKNQKSESLQNQAHFDEKPLQTRAQSLYSVNDKLLFDGEIATLTTFSEEEVVCLHYDRHRQSLFLNGQRVGHYLQYPHLTELLAEFKKALLHHQVPSDFMRAFDLQVSQIYTSEILNTLEP